MRSASTPAPRSETGRTVARCIVNVAMVGVGVTHFTSPEFFLAIMPPFIPFHLAMVWLSGACEIALGLALVPERTRRLASFGLIALYVAVFPANIYMAGAHIPPGGEPLPTVVARARWSLQPHVILLVIKLPGITGLSGMAQLRQAAPHCAINIVTVYENESNPQQDLSAGADAHMTKQANFDRLLTQNTMVGEEMLY